MGQWFKWDNEAIAALTRMWGSGQTAKQIAAVFKVTRNAIIGKVHRLGLTTPERPGPKRPKRVRKKKPGKLAAAGIPALHGGSYSTPVKQIPPPPSYSTPVKQIPPPPSIADSNMGVSFMDLAHHHCREVIGVGPDKLAIYCGEPKAERFMVYGVFSIRPSYCEYHARINYKSS